MKGHILVFSMAFNGYQRIFRHNIESHASYARRFGFDYAFIEKPAFSTLFLECCWAKIPLIISALAKGYDWVFFIDAAAEIQTHCPDLRVNVRPDKSLYMANGHSGRINTGVIMIRNCFETRNLFKTIQRNFHKTVPTVDSVGCGESAHVIHYAKNFSGLETLLPEWNNTCDPAMADFIRQYSDSRMRRSYLSNPTARIAVTGIRTAQRVIEKVSVVWQNPSGFPDRLYKLYLRCIEPHVGHFELVKKNDLFGVIEASEEKSVLRS